MVLKLQATPLINKIPFCVLDGLADHEEFLPMTTKVSSQQMDTWSMRNIWLKIRALKPLLKSQNNREFTNVKQQITD